MTRLHGFLVAGGIVLALGGAPTDTTGSTSQGSTSKGAPRAQRAKLISAAFEQPRLTTMKSLPARFVLTLVRQSPTPGWRFEIDSVEIDNEQHRVVARVTEIRPVGPTSQAITPTECRIDLGALTPGVYFVEVRLRRGNDGPHQPAQAFVLAAT